MMILVQIVLVLTVCVLIPFASYRIPKFNSRVLIEGEVIYKIVDLNYSFRMAYERLLGNYPLYINGESILYIDKATHALIWPESPLVMSENRYTIWVEVTTKSLWHKGFTPAVLKKLKRLEKDPIVRK